MNSDASDPPKTMKNHWKTTVFHGLYEIHVFTIFPPLAPILGHFFTSFRPQGPHLASLGPLLPPSGAPFGPPWGYFVAPWPHFWHVKAPLGANSSNLKPPSLILLLFLLEFPWFSMNFGKIFCAFPASTFFMFSLQIRLKSPVVFPIPPGISKKTKHQFI